MGNDVQLFDLLKFSKMVKWFKTVWAKSFFVVAGIIVGYVSGVTAVEWRIISDCKHLNAFRIDISTYSCNMKLVEK